MSKTDSTACMADGCSNPAKRGRKGYCELHYMRMYRNGSLAKKVTATAFNHSDGYRLIPANGHWLARGSSHAYEHRIVFHSHHGDGPFACRWCGVTVTWDDMHIDHLDDDKQNNAIGNLAASCPTCNQQRGAQKRSVTYRAKTGIQALGEVRTMSEWSRITGLSRAAIEARVKGGMTMDEALSKPRGKFGPANNLGKSNTDSIDWRGNESVLQADREIGQMLDQLR